MTAATVTIRNGVDTEKLFATLGLIEAQPELAVWEQSHSLATASIDGQPQAI